MQTEIIKPYAHLGLAVWTAVVVVAGLTSGLAAAYLGPKERVGLAIPGTGIATLVGGVFLLGAVSCALCVVPAFIGYIVGVLRAELGYPAREIPRVARSNYARLCAGILCAVVAETLLFWFWRRIPQIGDGLLIIIVASLGALAPPVVLVCSIVTGLRLARIGKATRHADAVCVHCGFAISHNANLSCPICGGEVCSTSVRSASPQPRV